MKINFSDILAESHETGLIILSDNAGTGKTTIFRHLELKLKELFPLKWILFVQLREHIQIYEESAANETLKNLIKIFKFNKFDAEIFSKLFERGDVVILWDGFDEISPKYSDFVLEMIGDDLKNIHWISTRPVSERLITDYFDYKVKYELKPFLSHHVQFSYF